MKRFLYTIALAIVVAVFCGAVLGCGAVLDQPINVRLEGDKLVWDEVEGASGYILNINNVEYAVDSNELDFLNSFDPDQYLITVTAVTKFGTRSMPSEFFEYRIKLPEYLKATQINNNTEISIGTDMMGILDLPADLVIPSTVLGKPVTKIDSKAFSGSGRLVSVVLPESLKTIGSGAFENCGNLTALEIPGSVEEIGDDIVSNTQKLSRLTVSDDNNTFKSDGNCIIRKADNALVVGCNASVIPDYVTKICRGAFVRCTFSELVLPQSLREIEDYGIRRCNELMQIEIPGSVNKIGRGVFANCEQLEKAALRDGITEIGSESFTGCDSLKEIVIPGSVEFIGDSAFSNCKSLQEIVIPGNVKLIGDSAFSYCKSLQEIVILDGVKTIDKSAFASCASFTKLTLPKSLEVIGDHAFEFCYSLQEIVIPDGVKAIGSYAFYNCEKAKKIVIAGSVKTIGDHAFERCNVLESLTLYNGITKIGKSAFDCMYVLDGLNFSVTLPESVVELGDYAFQSMTVYNSDICQIGYDDGVPYVLSVHPYYASAESRLPQREGYEFMGWALYENGPVQHANALRISSNGKKIYYVTFTSEQKQNVDENTVWYAVWEKDI